jgi:uroporphyrinogen decarboxylase
VKPTARIIAALKARHPGLPVIAFPREAGQGYIGFARATGADCVALDNSVTPEWAAEHVQKDGCVQGNLAPRAHGDRRRGTGRETRRTVVKAFSAAARISSTSATASPPTPTPRFHFGQRVTGRQMLGIAVLMAGVVALLWAG